MIIERNSFHQIAGHKKIIHKNDNTWKINASLSEPSDKVSIDTLPGFSEEINSPALENKNIKSDINEEPEIKEKKPSSVPAFLTVLSPEDSSNFQLNFSVGKKEFPGEEKKPSSVPLFLTMEDTFSFPQKPFSLKLEDMKQFDEKIFDKLSEFTDPATNEKRENFYATLFQDEDLQKRVTQMINNWTFGGEGKGVAMEAYKNIAVDDKAPSNQDEKTIQDILATRKERWKRLADKLGISVPETFHLYRGVRGDYAIESMVSAWSDEKSEDMIIPNYELSSWSLNNKVAEMFAEGPEPYVIYEGDIPFEKTLVDKWVDGAGFVTFCPDQEEVVVSAPKDTIKVPKSLASVLYKGKTYSYKDRKELIELWRKDHPE